MKETYYQRKTIRLIVFVTILRILIAAVVELGNDEVYYRLYARPLQWNYFDHPPMVGWLIRLTTLNLFFDNDVFIRLGAILSASAATWLIFLCGKKLADAGTGYLAAVLYSCCLYSSLISGVFILPDSPQLVCWTGGLLLLLRICSGASHSWNKITDILLFGVVTGLGMLCKIHTVFLWLGLILYVLLYKRRWLYHPAFYAAGLITCLFFLPVIKWNIDNHFISFTFHGSRVNPVSGGFDPANLLSFTAGQFLYMNPVICMLFFPVLWATRKNRLGISIRHKRILLLTAIPLLGLSFLTAIFRQVLPHWCGPSYCSMILLAAAYLRSKRVGALNNPLPFPLKSAAVVAVSIIFLGILAVNFYPGTLSTAVGNKKGEGDFTLDMYGWNDLRKQFRHLQETEVREGRIKPNSFIISNKWFPAAHLDHYVATPLQIPFVAYGGVTDIHQYAWVNRLQPGLQPGDDAWCIVPSNTWFDAAALFGKQFETITFVGQLPQFRSGKCCRYFYIYQLKNFRRGKAADVPAPE